MAGSIMTSQTLREARKYEETYEKYEETITTIDEYNKKIESSEEASELLDKELEKSNLIAGNTDVYGEGIIVTLIDNDEQTIKAEDLLELVNELRYAGAEAISINDVRIINTTDIVEVGNSLVMVGGQRLSSPYVVKAIGNQAYLSSILSLKNSGFIDKYKDAMSPEYRAQLNKYIEKSLIYDSNDFGILELNKHLLG